MRTGAALCTAALRQGNTPACTALSFSLLESWVLSAAVDYEFPGATVHVLVSPVFMGNSFSNPPSPLPHVDPAITIQ